MITNNSIQQIRDLDIEMVLGQYPQLKLKKEGARQKGKCPFHNEDTASFFVTPSKNMYKCFGCGASGDGLAFVMKIDNLSFIEAIRKVAGDFNITLEEEEVNPEKAREMEARANEKKSIQIVLDWATAQFQSNDVPEEFVLERRFSKELIREFRVGFASTGWSDLYDMGQKQLYDAELMVKAGLIRKKKDESGYIDYFRNRVMFPILDTYGKTIAFGGRWFGEKSEDSPKYVNSPESTWNKSDYVFGLYQARESIQKRGFVYHVEGYTDVMQCFQRGLKNTIAPCGTSLTEGQVKLLKRYTDKVIIIPDNDIVKEGEVYSAGIKALQKNAELYLKFGFSVRYLLPLDGQDPDSFIRDYCQGDDALNQWIGNHKDYITDWLFENCSEIAKISPADKVKQVQRMADVIEVIPEALLREVYFSEIKKIWTDFKTLFKAKKDAQPGTKEALEKLNQDQRRNMFRFEFFEKIDGEGCVSAAYYKTFKKSDVRICTFTMKMLFFIKHVSEPRYLVEFVNIFGEKRLANVKTDDFTSVFAFKRVLGRLGSVFEFEGNEDDLIKIKIKLFYGVKTCLEPNYMGYNKGGDYFTWANGLFYGKDFYKADNLGMVELRKPIQSIDDFYNLSPSSQIVINDVVETITTAIEFEERIGEDGLKMLIDSGQLSFLQFYYLPYASKMKSDEESDGSVEMKKMMKNFLVEGLNFNQWSKLMVEVYGDNGKIAVAYYIALIFRDIIYEFNNNYFPILFFFGMPQSGKSKCAESLSSMFGFFMPDGINLQAGGSTELGIKRYIASVQNGLIWLNEYKNSIPLSKIEMLKSLADGSGRLNAQKTNGTETQSFVPRSSAVVCGQDLPTVEPALLSRCICNEFGDDKRNYEKFEELKRLEKEGKMTAVTCELLSYRKEIYAYKNHFMTFNSKIKKYLLDNGIGKIEDRAVLNMATLLLPFQILKEKTDLVMPFEFEDLKKVLLERLKFQVEISHSAGDIEQYFYVLMSLNGGKFPVVRNGEHYFVGKEKDTNVLYLRIRPIHNKYLEAAKKQGVSGLSVSTIESYLKKHPSFIEYVPRNVRFQHLANYTSAYKLNYDKLMEFGIELVTGANLGNGGNLELMNEGEVPTTGNSDITDDLPF